MSDMGEFICDWSCRLLNDLSGLVLVWRSERRVWSDELCLRRELNGNSDSTNFTWREV